MTDITTFNISRSLPYLLQYDWYNNKNQRVASKFLKNQYISVQLTNNVYIAVHDNGNSVIMDGSRKHIYENDTETKISQDECIITELKVESQNIIYKRDSLSNEIILREEMNNNSKNAIDEDKIIIEELNTFQKQYEKLDNKLTISYKCYKKKILLILLCIIYVNVNDTNFKNYAKCTF